MARDLAARLVEIRRAEPDAPSVEPSLRPAMRPPAGEHLVLVDGGDDDTALVQEVADHLHRKHGINSTVPLKDKTGLESSDITRDRRDKLKLCRAMLIVYKDVPVHQIDRQITDYLKVKPQRPKSRPIPTLHLCHPHGEDPPLSFNLVYMQAYQCGTDCAADCAQRFAAGLPR